MPTKTPVRPTGARGPPEERDHEREPTIADGRQQHQLRPHEHVLAALVEHRAPLRGGRLRAETEERQPRDREQQRCGEPQARVRGERAHRVGQHVPEHDPPGPAPSAVALRRTVGPAPAR